MLEWTTLFEALIGVYIGTSITIGYITEAEITDTRISIGLKRLAVMLFWPILLLIRK